MTNEEVSSFLAARVPTGWFEGPLSVEIDDDEILCVGAPPPGTGVESFREQTRSQRMSIAGDAEAKFRRKVSWGVLQDGVRTVFTSQSIPVMTRASGSASAPCSTP